MTQALGEIRYLSDSDHRMTLLELLLEEPKTQSQLRERAAASSATVSRVLRSFAERGWGHRREGRYELTPIGRFVAREFIDLHDRLVAVEGLEGLIKWLPPDLVELGVECLIDADLTFPTSANPMAVIERTTVLGRHAECSRALSHYLPTMCIAGHIEALAEETQTLESVFNREIIETIAASQPTERDQLLSVLDSDRGTVHVYEGDVPVVLGIMDEIVYVGVENETGVLVALIETTDEAVFEWAQTTFETYREDATELTREAFKQYPSAT